MTCPDHVVLLEMVESLAEIVGANSAVKNNATMMHGDNTLRRMISRLRWLHIKPKASSLNCETDQRKSNSSFGSVIEGSKSSSTIALLTDYFGNSALYLGEVVDDLRLLKWLIKLPRLPPPPT